MTVNNGRRVAVTLPDFTGIAGFVERRGAAYLSYPAVGGKQTLMANSQIEVAGQTWAVERAEDSPYVPGFRVVILRKGL